MTQKIQPSTPERVLIVKPSALGDIVTALPILRGLRRSFPSCRISWLVSDSCLGIIEQDSDIDECVVFHRKRLGRAWRSVSARRELKALRRQLKAGGYDWTIDLQGLLRSALFSRWTGAPVRAGFEQAREGARLFYTHRFDVDWELHTVDRNIALVKGLGIDARPEDMTLQISAAGREFTDKFVQQNELDGGFVVCVPPTRWATKLYPVRHWRTVVSALRKHMPVVLIGSPADEALCQSVAEGLGSGVVNAAGQTNLPQMAALIAASRGVVCCDSAAKFIAPAVGVDCVTLIGPTRVSRTGPYLRGRAVLSPAPCRGCLKRICSHITCMELLEPAAVISAAEEMLGVDERA